MNADFQTSRSSTIRQRTHRARTIANAIMFTFVAGSLAIMGCTSSGSWSGSGSNTSASKLGLSQHGQGTATTRTYVQQQSQQTRLPGQYVSEAQVGLAHIEQVLAEARAAEVEHTAALEQGLARVEAHRRHAEAYEQGQMAEAEKIRDQYAARQNELWVSIAARERALVSEVEKNASLVDALLKEREQVYGELTSRAWREYNNAQAQVEKLRSIHQTTVREGEAALSELRESGQATKSRAVATVAQLRSEANATRDQSNARAQELVTRISTVRERTGVESSRLASEADSIEKDVSAQFNEMMARADAMIEQDAGKDYELRVNTARTAFQKAKSEYEHLISRAESDFERANAQIKRLQADAEEIAFLGESKFRFGSDELDAWFENEQAEIEKMHVRAMRIEKNARSEFVKVEAEARANAKRETSAHQSELADAMMKAIIAEAEAEATQVRAAILDELARRQQQGSVEFTGKTDPEPEMPADLHVVPTVPHVEPVTPRVEPEHIAAFRSELARVMNIRANADAKQLALEATFEESSEQLKAVRAQFLAMSAEKLAIAEAMRTQAVAQFNDRTAQSNAFLAMAEAGHERALADAEAFRKEVIAEASELRGRAKVTKELGLAQASLLRVESDVVRNNGQSEVRALEAALEATRQRGEAEFRRLWVEADSVEQSQKALIEQINVQITSAERVLAAELAKQDRSIQSAIAVAEANYKESMVNADVFARKTEVGIDRLAAQHAHEHALVAAEIDHLRNLSYSAELKADAEVTRIVAGARATREQADALADVNSASLYASADIARADFVARSRTARANEEAVKATFDARVVQVQSERVRDLIDQYRDDIFRQTNLETALAEAEAIRSQMNERFAAIKIEQSHLQRAATRDWDSRLARMQQRRDTGAVQPALSLPDELENIVITNVPTDRD